MFIALGRPKPHNAQMTIKRFTLLAVLFATLSAIIWAGCSNCSMGTKLVFLALYVLLPFLVFTTDYLSKERGKFGNRDFPGWLRVKWQPPFENNKAQLWNSRNLSAPDKDAH